MPRQYNKLEDKHKIFIADYMNAQFPEVPFWISWDHVRLPIGVAAKFKRMRWKNPCFTWPDVFIAKGKNDPFILRNKGLFLEVKKDKGEIFKLNGEIRSGEQIIKENNSLRILRELGYEAEFTWSPERSVELIRGYLL